MNYCRIWSKGLGLAILLVPLDALKAVRAKEGIENYEQLLTESLRMNTRRVRRSLVILMGPNSVDNL